MYSFYQKSPMTIFMVNKCENVVIFDNAVLKRKKIHSLSNLLLTHQLIITLLYQRFTPEYPLCISFFMKCDPKINTL